MTHYAKIALLRCALRFAKRAGLLRRAGVIVGLAAALPLAMFLTVSSLALDPEQRSQRDVGRLGGTIDLSVFIDFTSGDNTEGLARDVARAETESGNEVLLQLLSFDVRPSSGERVTYLETDWTRDPYPGRYEIVSGRLPQSPGEVVLDAGTQSTGSSSLDVFSGNESLTITGIIIDKFAESRGVMLAAPGTWASFNWALLSQRFPEAGPQASILYDPRAASADAVVASILRDVISPRIEGPSPTELPPVALLSRDGILLDGRADLFTAIPVLLPLVAWSIPMLGMATLAGAGWMLLNRRVGSFRAVGLPIRDASAIVAAATIIVGLVAGGVGLLAGAGLAVGVRPLLDRWADQPLSPMPSVVPVVAQEVAGLLLVGALVWVALARGNDAAAGAIVHVRLRRGRLRSNGWSGRRLVDLLLSIGILILAMQVLTATTDSAAFGTLGGALVVALLALPRLVRTVVGWLPQHGATWRLARRRMEADQARIITGVALIASLIGPTISMLMLIHMSQVTDESQQLSLVAEGQVEVLSYSPESLLELVRTEMPSGALAVTTYSLDSESQATSTKSDGLGAVLTVKSVSDLESLNGAEMPPAAAETLVDGGLLLTSPVGTTGPGSLYVTDINSGDVTALGPLEVAVAELNPILTQRFASVILASTAVRLSLPMNLQSTVFTGLSPEAVAAVNESVVVNGYDPALVLSYDPQEPFPVPLPVLVASGVLLAALLMLTMWLSRSQAAALRPYAAALIAIGLPLSWSRRIAVRQGVLVILFGLFVGCLVAAVPVTVATLGPAALDFSVPFLSLAIVALAVVVAAIVGIRLGTLSLSTTDRTVA